MQNSRKLHPDEPAWYTIQIQGRLRQHWVAAFDPMTLTVDLDEEQTAVSTLRGLVVDQAALQGLLRTLYSLGLPLLLVRWETPGQEREAEA